MKRVWISMGSLMLGAVGYLLGTVLGYLGLAVLSLMWAIASLIWYMVEYYRFLRDDFEREDME